MTTICRCWACTDFRAAFYQRTDEELITLVNTTDDRHRFMRVFAFIELYYRCGVFDPSMPYRVWRIVMGPGVPPPFSSSGFGAFRAQPDWRSLGWAQVH